MEFANKEFLFLLFLVIPYIIWYFLYRKKGEPAIRLANTFPFSQSPRSWRVLLMPVLSILRVLVFVFLVIALARPQTHDSKTKENVEGIDIMMAMDVSTSMLAEDIRDRAHHARNRLEAAKVVAAEFVSDRPNDNIGLTIFAGEAFTQCPMTTDHASLLSLLQNVRTDIAARGLIEDGTAIGMGIANAVSRLKDSQAKSRVVILLTDGTNNRGDISPMTAAEIANSLGVRIYTIGVGTNGTAPYPLTVGNDVQYIQVPVEIDTKTLSDIASTTNGKFYRATNAEELRDIYHEIDQLEKSKLEVQKFSRFYEDYQRYAFIAFVLLLIEILMRVTIFRRIP